LSGADNNSAAVTGTGAGWTNNGSFIIGSGGNFNQVTLSGGAVVVTTNGVTTLAVRPPAAATG